jgi:DNA-binding HxlR family transcriptional regulator
MPDKKKTKRPYSCGLEAALDILNGKWKPLILRGMKDGPRRYGKLRRFVPDISEKMLIQHLKELEADGVVVKKNYHENPPRVEYSLTPFGAEMIATLSPLCNWGKAHVKEIAKMKGRGAKIDDELVSF